MPKKGYKQTKEHKRKCALNRPDISGENNPMFGRHHSEKTKEKLRTIGRSRKHSEETKLKISLGNKGKDNSGNKNPMFGKHHSEETKEKIRQALIGKHFGSKRKGCPHSEEWKRQHSEQMKGKNNPRWQGGINPEHYKLRKCFEAKYWRVEVYKRDLYVCQSCGHRGGKLHAHHIKSFSKYPDLRYDINNGMTLCEDCHINLHKELRKGKKYVTSNMLLVMEL